MSTWQPLKAGSKYRNRKAVTSDGKTLDSKRERKRYEELLIMQRSGDITDLQTQVQYTLIPAQRATPKGPMLERACKYIADFAYRDSHGTLIVEDAKGFPTPEYIIKRKLMLYMHGIIVSEI